MNTLPTLNESLRQLIAAPSVSSSQAGEDMSNRPVIDLLAEWCEALGFSVQILSLASQPSSAIAPGIALSPLELLLPASLPSKANLIATLGSGPGGLLLSGHTDTVPCDPALWSSDPFKLTERDGRYYGLGTCDMKAFFAIALAAVHAMPLKNLAAPLVLVATADEETTMDGAKALLQQHTSLPPALIIGEPSGLKPIRMHKGIFTDSVRIIGKSGHSSDPMSGRNALEGARQVMDALDQWRKELARRYQNPAFRIPYPTLNFGVLHGGNNPNKICAECELQFDLRPLPDMPPIAALREEIAHLIQAATANLELKVVYTPLCDGIPGFESPADLPWVKTVEALSEHPAGTAAFGTEAPYFQRLGCTPIILGPGSIEQAHQADEYLDAARIPKMQAILQKLIATLVLGAKP